jgi:diguanylate cyclase (GGDEF)-like protein
MSETPSTGQPIETALAPEFIDDLTGLPNRKWLMGELEGLVVQEPGHFGLLFVDIDGLKRTNDEQGHAAGDQLILDAAKVLEGNVRGPQEKRPADQIGRVAARLAGDEFVIILRGVKQADEIEIVKTRLQQKLGEQSIEASMGGRVHKPVEPGDVLLNAVDRLMYEDKEDRYRKQIRQLPLRQRAAYHAASWLNRRLGAADRPRG